MNRGIIRYVLGSVIKIEAILLMVPLFTALIYHESEGKHYLAVALVCLITGSLLTFKKPHDSVFYLKEGCISTAASWIVLSLFGAIPFVLTGEIPHYLDALFETVSGFTTTGASIVEDVESFSHCSLLWRSFTHWIGGMGVLVFLLAIIPMSGGGSINLMRAESPGPSVGKLAPKMKTTASILYTIYICMTMIEFALLVFAKMPVFDAICTAFATAGTGGYGIKNSSIGDYSVPIQWIVTIFMILFGVNFNAYYYLQEKDYKKAFAMEEVRTYFIVIFAAIAAITFNILKECTGFFDALTKSAFQVGSIITTTGFSTTDFDTWPAFSKTILVLLMFVGACAGSTGGGIKISRFIIFFKAFFKEADSYIHPKSVKKITIDNKPLAHDVLRSTNVFLNVYILVFVCSILIVSLDNRDMQTNFTAVVATFNNIGPGLADVGPTQNFNGFSYLSKVILMIDMLAGRLELFPIIILFHPELWKEFLWRRDARRKKIQKMIDEKKTGL
ncbi:MAG: TrkH family potassium uptake protein [Lachnospiraceae bacterium]|nr:TrkH family potassium uptake protein [Lachnospiraceae bacterium]